MIHFIEVYKAKGNNDSHMTGSLPLDYLEQALASTKEKGNLETIAIFKLYPPKTK